MTDKVKMWVYGGAVATMIISTCVAVKIGDLTEAGRKKVEVIEAVSEMPEIGQISLYEDSGMPCENPKQFERWLNEQETDEEESHGTEGSDNAILLEESKDEGSNDEVTRSQESSSEVETESQIDSEISEVQEGWSQYKIMGESIDVALEERLYLVLEEAHIPHWYEFAICQLFQESRGEKYAVSKDGKDHGILQYRLQYWDEVCKQYGYEGASIYDTDVQLQIYAKQMSERLNQGLSAEECISRHKTSDEVTAVDWEYVGQVKQWLNKMEVVE